MSPLRIYIGYDTRELEAYHVAAASIRRHASRPVEVQPLVLDVLRTAGLYTRRTRRGEDGRLFDEISGKPMSTEFALTRFLVPKLAGYQGWALYADCDFLFRADVAELFDMAEEQYAVMVVKHNHQPGEAVKMDNQVQLAYPRKNWSSLVLWNCGHWIHDGQVSRVARWAGIHLHQFNWIADERIGDLPEAWNWLEGVSAPDIEPKAVHFTRGTPAMPGYENVAFASEWKEELAHAGRKAAA
jgi:lipopolysaccharide biosynthesis glycosyltransferase